MGRHSAPDDDELDHDAAGQGAGLAVLVDDAPAGRHSRHGLTPGADDAAVAADDAPATDPASGSAVAAAMGGASAPTTASETTTQTVAPDAATTAVIHLPELDSPRATTADTDVIDRRQLAEAAATATGPVETANVPDAEADVPDAQADVSDAQAAPARRRWSGRRRGERRPSPSGSRRAGDPDDDTGSQGLSLIESAFTGDARDGTPEATGEIQPVADADARTAPPPQVDAPPVGGVRPEVDAPPQVDARPDTTDRADAAVSRDTGDETAVIPVTRPVADEFPPIDLDRVPADLRRLLEADADLTTTELTPAADARTVETTADTTTADRTTAEGPADDAPVDATVDDEPTIDADATAPPTVVVPVVPIPAAPVIPPEPVRPAPAPAAAPTPASAPPAAGAARLRHRNPTSSDLDLMRHHSDVRARCIAALVVPFLIYIAIMVARSAELATGLIWIWIPLITAGVLFGLFLDLGHRRYDDSGVTFTRP